MASLQAAANPARVLMKWESQALKSNCSATIRAVEQFYKDALAYIEEIEGKTSHTYTGLQAQREKFLAQDAVKSVLTVPKYTSSRNLLNHAVTSKLTPRGDCLSKLLSTEKSYVSHLKFAVTTFVQPLADISAGASLSARRQSVHQAAVGHTSRRRFSFTISRSPHKKRDRYLETRLRSGGIAVLWSTLQQIVTLNSKFLVDFEAVVGDATSPALVGDILQDFTPLLAMYSKFFSAHRSTFLFLCFLILSCSWKV